MRTFTSQKIAHHIFKFMIILIFSTAAAGNVGAVSAAISNDALRIIYSGGLTGNIEPCG